MASSSHVGKLHSRHFRAFPHILESFCLSVPSSLLYWLFPSWMLSVRVLAAASTCLYRGERMHACTRTHKHTHTSVKKEGKKSNNLDFCICALKVSSPFLRKIMERLSEAGRRPEQPAAHPANCVCKARSWGMRKRKGREKCRKTSLLTMNGNKINLVRLLVPL